MTTRGPRSLQVISALGMGGAETWLMEVLRLWRRESSASMDFIATSGEPGLFDDEAISLGARIHYLRFGRRTMPQFVAGFSRLLAENRYDAIHDHQDYPSGWHFLAGAGRLPPVRVTHVHNPSYQILNNNGLTASKRAASRMGKALVQRFATHIGGTSRQLIGEYGFDEAAFSRTPKSALYCGFDPLRFAGDAEQAHIALRRQRGWPDDAKVILFAGRMDQSPDPGASQNHKNSGFALAVALAAMQRDPRVRLLMVGQASPAEAVLRARIAQAGAADRALIEGVNRNIEGLMLGADVLLFPSRGEGLGMVAVEAQAAGLPVLASSAVPHECVVVPELVRFLDLDAPVTDWAQAVLELIDQPRDVATANQAVGASPFAIEASAQSLLTLYATGQFATR